MILCGGGTADRVTWWVAGGQPGGGAHQRSTADSPIGQMILPLRSAADSVEVLTMAVIHPNVDSTDAVVVDQDRFEPEGPVDGFERRRLLFVSSAGGHLAQLLQLRPWWANHDRRWVSFDLPDARSKLEGEDVVFAHHPTTRNLINLARNTPLAYRVLRDFRPDVVISTGAGVALPFFAMARTMGVPSVYLEVYDRIDSRTLTGRLCRPFTSLFCVQWPEQQSLYTGSMLTGPVY